MEKIADIYNYRAANSKLSTAGQPTEKQLAAAAQEGFEVVINLALHDDPHYSLRDEPGLVRSLGLEYVHIHVQFNAPTETDLLAFFAAMERHETSGFCCTARQTNGLLLSWDCMALLNSSSRRRRPSR